MRDEDQDGPENRPAWAWIDLDALRHNARRAIECAAGRTVIGVVKANGYGHGAETIARGLMAEGISRLAVVSVGEGAELRRAGIVAPILVMGELGQRESVERAMKWNLTPVLHDRRDFELARSLGRAGAPLAVEIEVDTGMHRMGVARQAASGLIRDVAETPGLALTGVYTHLACAEEADPTPCRLQIGELAKILDSLGETRGKAPVHVANSAGLLRLSEIETEQTGLVTQAVRPGLMLYGVSPFPDRSAASLGLRPVMSLACRVVALHDVAAGQGVGYGAVWRAPAGGARIATLPLGYADGLPRSLTAGRAAGGEGAAEVQLAGGSRKIVGRVSMDYIAVDVSGSDAGVGSLATIFGATAAGESIPVERIAAAAGTIGYEMLTSVGSRVPRHVGDGPPPMADPGGLDQAV